MRLTVIPHAVTRLEPPAALLSMPAPTPAMALDIVARFCAHVHFLAVVPEGARWRGEHPGTQVLTVAQGFELGQRIIRMRGLV